MIHDIEDDTFLSKRRFDPKSKEITRRIQALKAEKAQAVATENYERASQLKGEIDALQQELQSLTS